MRSRLAALMPGAGHIVHMPAHIYYRVGMYRESLVANQRAIEVDERLLQDLAVRPALQVGLLPAQHPLRDGVGADGRRREDRDRCRRRSSTPRCRTRWSRQFPILQPIKAAPYTTHAQFSDADTILEAAGAAGRPRAGRDDVPLRARGRLRRASKDARRRAARDRRDRAHRARRRLQAVRRVGPAGEGDRADRAPGRQRPARRRARRPRRRREGLRGRDRASRTRWPTPSRRTGTTRCASRSARCGCARASSTRRRRRSASRWRACATTAGRSPGWSRSRSAGDAKAEQAARAAFERAWFGAKEGPDLSRL